ncbi:MAG TPA: AsmA family protein [Stellaceae bacterium]|nr:AsmA family protein [Stellaceae bacterium]
MIKRQHPWFVGLGILAAAIIILVAVWRWDWFIPLVNSQASVALGRPVTVSHLAVRLERVPMIEIDGLTIGNPQGWPADSRTASDHMATIDRLSVRFDVPAFVKGTTRIPEIAIERLQADLRTDATGRPNWDFSDGKPRDPTAPPQSFPDIGTLRISDSRVHFEDPAVKSNFDVDLNTKDTVAGGEAQIVAEVKGTYAAQPVTASFVGGSLLTLRDTTRPYPIDLSAQNGQTKVRIKGTVQQPMAFAGADISLELQGDDMSKLYPLTAIPLPRTPTYHIKGMLDYADRKIHFRDFSGTLGSSDLSGNLTEEPGQDRPLVTMDLTSHKVALADLGGFIGATPGKTDAPNQSAEQKREHAVAAQSSKLLPDTPINLPRLRAADLKVTYKGERIEGESMPLDNLTVNATVEDGRISLKPLSFGVGQGQMAATIDLDGQQDPVHVVADVDFRQVDVKRLMAATKTFQGAGMLGGRARIDTTGNSLAQMLGRGNGDLTLFMTGGEISSLLVDLAGLEVGTSLIKLLGFDKPTPIRCMITDLGLQRGVLSTQTLLVDTKESNILGRGDINLATEQINFQITTEPKRFSIGTLSAPIDITGALKNPSILPNPVAVGERAGPAAILGMLLTPLGALLPTIQLGLGKDNDCVKLIAEAQSSAATPKPIAQ